MNNQPEKQQGIYMDESQGMDEAQRELFLNVRRSKSDDSFLGRLLVSKEPIETKRQLILDINDNNQNNMGGSFSVFKRVKKEKKKNQSDYRKNICGYITKKIIREFVGPNYACHVQDRCDAHQVDYNAVKSHYLAKIEQVTGPSHIPRLLVPQNEGEVKIKQVFCEFFEWFLKERYLRYLILEGKMSDKKAYIEYKNNILLSMLEECKGVGIIKKQEIQDEQQQQSSSEEEEGSPG